MYAYEPSVYLQYTVRSGYRKIYRIIIVLLDESRLESKQNTRQFSFCIKRKYNVFQTNDISIPVRLSCCRVGACSFKISDIFSRDYTRYCAVQSVLHSRLLRPKSFSVRTNEKNKNLSSAFCFTIEIKLSFQQNRE